jgi:hypothetical protein
MTRGFFSLRAGLPVAFVLVLGLAPPRTATAQPQPPTVSPEARALAMEGMRLLDDQRFADAATSFERSLALFEAPSTLYNLGMAYRGMNRCTRATDAFRRFLGVVRDAALRADGEVRLAEMDACVVRVHLTVTGASQEVKVDGEPQSLRDGEHSLLLDPGVHRFEASRSGYHPQVSEWSFARGDRRDITVDAAARPMPFVLVVEPGNARAVIRVDGRALDPGQYTVETTHGTHRVEVVYPGGDTQRREMHGPPGGRLSLQFTERVVVRESRSVVTRWWFWTILGAAVAGGVTTAVLLWPSEVTRPQPTWGTTVISLTLGL